MIKLAIYSIPVVILLIVSLALLVNLRNRRYMAVVPILMIGAWTFLCSFTNIPTGVVKVPLTLGTVAGEPLTEGQTFLAPWQSTVEFTTFPHTKVAGGKFMAKDKVEVTGEIKFSFRVNPAQASLIKQKFGNEEKFVEFVEAYCQSAPREAGATMEWEPICLTDREAFEKSMLEKAIHITNTNFVKLGLTEEQAASIVIFSPPVVQSIYPSDRVSLANNELAAAKIDEDRQKVLTNIAKETANRREQEGKGIAMMMNAIPPGHKPAEVADIIRANAEYKLAEAGLKGVEQGKVEKLIISAVPATTSAD